MMALKCTDKREIEKIDRSFVHLIKKITVERYGCLSADFYANLCFINTVKDYVAKTN